MFVSEARLARHPEEGGEVLLHICRVDEVLDHKARSMPTRPAGPRGGGGRSFARLHGGSSAAERYSSSPLQGRGAMLEAALLCVFLSAACWEGFGMQAEAFGCDTGDACYAFATGAGSAATSK